MSSLVILSVIIIAAFVFLCYLFNESRIELDSLTIAAIEARSETAASRERKTPTPSRTSGKESPVSPTARRRIPSEEVEPSPAVASMPSYQYRELLKESDENYVIPQWMINFFSSSDICHTLDSSDRVVLMAKLTDARNADDRLIDISAECDMSTQTVALKVGFGQGVATENFKTKFYLFEREDLFELNRLVRQDELRIDIVTRSADYTLEYLRTLYTRIPQQVLAQLKNVLSKIPS